MERVNLVTPIQVMDVPPAGPRDDRGPLPGLEPTHDCRTQVVADFERAVAPIRRNARQIGLPATEVDDAVQGVLCQAGSMRVNLARGHRSPNTMAKSAGRPRTHGDTNLEIPSELGRRWQQVLRLANSCETLLARPMLSNK